MDAALQRVLEATGYLVEGEPAAASVGIAGVGTEQSHSHSWMRFPSFQPDSWWSSDSAASSTVGGQACLRSFFKYVENPAEVPVADWQKEVWNLAFVPLLWIVSPDKIELHSGFGFPQTKEEAPANLIATCSVEDEELARLDAVAGRLVMETGQFWERLAQLTRVTSVDVSLLRHLRALEKRLADAGLELRSVHTLLRRTIFALYVVDRGLVNHSELAQVTGCHELCNVFEDREATGSLLGWLREKFNGDVIEPIRVPARRYLQEVGAFLSGIDPETRRTSLFPYRFDLIPIGLISSILEKLVSSAPTESINSRKQVPTRVQGALQMPLTVASLVSAEVLDGLSGNERVVDLSCGSGVFLVQALRCLVFLKTRGNPTRKDIRDVLYDQIHGFDMNVDVVRVASLGLYLAALELDPDPRNTEGIKFRSLEGKTLHVGDPFESELDNRKYDVIVGSSLWSFAHQHQQETDTRQVRHPVDRHTQNRRRDLDFMRLALGLATGGTRIGMLLRGTTFFERRSTSRKAIQTIVKSLDDVTLVNLSELCHWLFPNARMPAIVLLGTYRDCNEPDAKNEMVLAHASWSSSGQRSQLIELSPNDVTVLPLASWQRDASLFKAAFLGYRYDLLLLEDLSDRFARLGEVLRSIGTSMRKGLTRGNSSKDATFLTGMPVIQRDVRHFSIPEQLPPFSEAKAERPHQLNSFLGPLLLVGESFRAGIPRVVATLLRDDIVYTDAYFGIPLGDLPEDVGYLLAGILSSSLSSWYLLMSASSFGIWFRRIKKTDLMSMPTPSLMKAAETGPGKRIISLVRAFHSEPPNSDGWADLDEAVAGLYGLDDDERTVVEDGLIRAYWQWRKGRREAVAGVQDRELKKYAETFLSSMDCWLGESQGSGMRGEIYQLGTKDPVRVVRFLIDDDVNDFSHVSFIRPNSSLTEVLNRIGQKTRVRVSSAVLGNRDLRVHCDKEVYIVKPAARRNWLRINALEDADSVVQDVFDGVSAE